ncbi:MAG: hypothetical protein ABSE82_10065 [Nitrososphaerales archaeon]|jgi:putative flippase GtrA
MAKSADVLKRTHVPQGRRTLELARKYGFFRIFKFAMATGTGFLVNETILVVGIFAVYHRIGVPSFGINSLTILGLDVLALGTGDTIAFMINERVTVGVEHDSIRKGRLNWLVRWGKYQLAALTGNVMIAGVQLTLLATISLFPAVGSIVGAMVSYPVTYAISMHFVWGVHPFKE